MKRLCLLAAVASMFIAGTASADIFSDNFDTEALGLSKTVLTNWTVTNGTVDVIGANSNGGETAPFYDLVPGNGNYIDLDGTSSPPVPGIMHLTNTVALVGPGWYNLQFDLAGNHRGSTDSASALVSVSGSSKVVSLGSGSPFQHYYINFHVNTNTYTDLTFSGLGEGDNIGLLLDNIRLNAGTVPVPGAALLIGIGLSLVGWLKRRMA